MTTCDCLPDNVHEDRVITISKILEFDYHDGFISGFFWCKNHGIPFGLKLVHTDWEAIDSIRVFGLGVLNKEDSDEINKTYNSIGKVKVINDQVDHKRFSGNSGSDPEICKSVLAEIGITEYVFKVRSLEQLLLGHAEIRKLDRSVDTKKSESNDYIHKNPRIFF